MQIEQNEKFHEMLSEFDSAMLVTHSSGKLLGRPMMFAQVEDTCDVWFFTSEETEKIDEIRADADVLVCCQREMRSYLSLVGTATIITDRQKIEALWREPFRVWFPKGVEDPKIALIRVKAERGEYWDTRGTNRVQYLFQALTAYATGTIPEVEEGDQHGEVQL